MITTRNCRSVDAAAGQLIARRAGAALEFAGGGLQCADGAKSGVSRKISHATAVKLGTGPVVGFAFEIQPAAFPRCHVE